jgi:nucleotide-binding universal stress UspA family protein
MVPMKVLVAVDKSPESRTALRYTCHLLDHFDAQVDAIYVKPDVMNIVLEDFDIPFIQKADPKQKIEAEAQKIQQEIENACEVCLAGKVPCEPQVIVGEPAEEILQFAEQGDHDMIVLGSHGRSSLKGFLLGTVHNQILHHATVPVMIVRELHEIHRVLVAYRGSKCDQDALRFVAPMLRRKKPEVTILHVQEVDRGESDAFAKACLVQGRNTLKELGHTPATKTAEGDFVEETLKEIMVGDYDLVVLGAYGHERPKYLKVLSDEALRLVGRTTRPVLVFREKSDH